MKASTAVNNLNNVRIIRIGQDLFIEKVDEHVDDDLHNEVRVLSEVDE